MEALGNFISFFNLPASYVAEHYANKCIVEYRTDYDELYRRDLRLKSLCLDEQVLDKMIDGTINTDFDDHDIELIEAYNLIEDFCGDKDWGYTYEAARDLIASAKAMDSQDIFERKLRRRMHNKEAVEIALGMQYDSKRRSMNVCGCEKILVVNCVDLFNMYCQYCDSLGVNIMNEDRFYIILKECYENGFLAERDLFWHALLQNRSTLSYFNNSAKVGRELVHEDDQNHVRFKLDGQWDPNHELSCSIVRMRYNEDSHQWEYVL